MRTKRMSARRSIVIVALMFATGCTQCSDPEGNLKHYLGLDEIDAGPARPPMAAANPDGGAVAPPAAATGAAPAAAPVEPLSACAILAGPRRNIEPASAVLSGTISGGEQTVAMIGNKIGTAQLVHVGDYIGSHCWRVTAIRSEWAQVQRIPNPAKPHVEGSDRIYLSGGPPHAHHRRK